MSSVSAKPSAHLWNAFLSGLRDAGYIEGQNVAIESRWPEGEPDRLPGLATDLVGLKVDVIVSTGGTVSALRPKMRGLGRAGIILTSRPPTLKGTSYHPPVVVGVTIVEAP